MNFEKLRQIALTVAACIFLLSAMLPNVGVMGMTDMSSGTPAVTGTMCPRCGSSMMKLGAGCAQVSCIGFAVIDQLAALPGSNRQTFPLLAVIPPGEVSWAPPTPPI
jgi:hypothetical protein